MKSELRCLSLHPRGLALGWGGVGGGRDGDSEEGLVPPTPPVPLKAPAPLK